MSIRKIADFDPCKDNGTWNAFRGGCKHSEHAPPSMIVYSPGIWEHTCPGCNNVTTFTIYPSHLCKKEHTVVQPKIRPIDCVVHQSVQKEDDESFGHQNPFHETRTCQICGEKAYRHHIC